MPLPENKDHTKNQQKDLPIILGLIAALTFFLAICLVSYASIATIRKDVALVTHTHEVIVGIEAVLSLMKDAETGQRGYVLTGNEPYLAPYEAAARAIVGNLDQLQELTRDNPEQQAHIARARILIDVKLQELNKTIELRRSKGFSQALALVMTDHGKNVMDELRGEFVAMRQIEMTLRAGRLQAMEGSYSLALAVSFGGSTIGIILSLLVVYLLRHAAALRRQEEWFQAGQVGLAKVMLGDLTLEQLGHNVLKFFAEYLDAHAGLFYARDRSDFQRAAIYGLPVEAETPGHFASSDGLLGQAARDARSFVVHDVPEGYLRIGSGLGSTNPRHLVISSTMADGAVNAVFELGFLHEVDRNAIDLLKQVAGSIGTAVQSAIYRENLQKLFEETQSQAEELQAQSEELRSSNEELEEQTRNLQESQARLEQQQEELAVTNEEMEEKAKILEEQNTRIKSQTRDLQEAKDLLENKAKELELSSKYKSEFLANMSHELRTPLNSLLILSRSLAENEDGNLTSEQVEEMQVIHNGGLELLNLINDILDLSKVEAGKLNFIAEDTPTVAIIKKISQQFEPIAKEKGLAFHIEKADDLPVSIHTDGQRVEQILKNLLSNAFKFTEKGSVTLKVTPGEKETIQFAVIDTGIGIEQAKLNDIFEAFQQEDGSTDRHYGGTGLGLTIARKFARILGGEIHVSSAKGQGSTFTLRLPVVGKKQGMPEKEIISVSRNTEAGEKIKLKAMPKVVMKDFIADDRETINANDKVLLVIEDDRNFAGTLLKIAHKRGYKCLAAGDGKSGILLASEYPVSAIILDLKLPDMDGINVLDQLKQSLKTRHIPVHIITGRVDADNVVPLRKGAIGYLTKPVASEQIDGAFTKIENLLQAKIKKILVVEDDKKTQTAVQSLLNKKDIEIICIGMGETALTRVKKEKFDCVILDLSLPDMSGFEWLERMEKQLGTADPPPVIVYTARDLTEDENRRLGYYTGSVVIKGVNSSDRLLDEVTLFLHSVESSLTKGQQDVIRMQHDPDKVLQGRTILLVDDDMRNVFALSKMLKKHGMNVVVADNGQMALDRLDENKTIDLVVMDIMMPIMDGYQAMRATRAKKEFQALPIIALTARAMPEEQERCIAAGANDYLMKPVDIDRLLTLMRVWLFRQGEAA